MSKYRKREVTSMKKKLLIGLAVLVLIVLLFPIKLQYSDGGSVAYQSLVGIYRVTDWHQMLSLDQGEGYKEGISVEIFGAEIYNNTYSNLVD